MCVCVCVCVCVYVCMYMCMCMCMDLSTPQGGEWTPTEVRSLCCSWHGVGWAEAMLQIWTRRCCYQGRSYEALTVWRTSNSYCVGWPPPTLPFASFSTIRGQRAFMFSICLVSMVTAQTAYWNEWKFSLRWPIWIDILNAQDRNMEFTVHPSQWS